jgi:hypothetical protein
VVDRGGVVMSLAPVVVLELVIWAFVAGFFWAAGAWVFGRLVAGRG